MILIEFYTPRHIENISTCLRLKPKKFHLIGLASEASDALNRYNALLAERHLPTRGKLENIVGDDFGELCVKLADLLAPKEQYVIDLSGGDATAIMALGAVYAGLSPEKRKDIQVVRYDEDLTNLLDCLNNYAPLPYEPVSLTVSELIQLHGGIITPESYQPPKTFTAKHLESLWALASDPKSNWNDNLTILIQFQSYNQYADGIRLELDSLVGEISDFSEKELALRDFLQTLDKLGVIEDRSSFDYLEYRYTDPTYRYCMEKAGNILELKVFLEARDLTENGKPYFNDCLMSVSIDWDGIVHARKEKPDTRNEIDVIVMHGLIPTFISCKNGTINEAELYKLNTVANEFGGPHVQKLLLATKPEAVSQGLWQRGFDMDILLRSDIAPMSRQEWRTMFTHIEEELNHEKSAD